MMFIRLRTQEKNRVSDDLMNGRYVNLYTGRGHGFGSAYDAIMQAIAGLFHIGLSSRQSTRTLSFYVSYQVSCFI